MQRATVTQGQFLYKGQGLDSFYRHGVYKLVVRCTLFGRIKIHVTRGYDNQVSGSARTYRNWEAFMQDWEAQR